MNRRQTEICLQRIDFISKESNLYQVYMASTGINTYQH